MKKFRVLLIINTVILACISNTGCEETKTITPSFAAGKLIILQAYGNEGENAPQGISHSFVELYNISDTNIDLDGISLYYANGKPAGAADDHPWNRIDLTGTVKAGESFLILGKKHGLFENARYKIPDNSGDINLSELSLSRRGFKAALLQSTEPLTVQNPYEANPLPYYNEIYIDMIGTANEFITRDQIFGYERLPARNSASVAVRRTDEYDSDNNKEDFESLDYRLENGMTDELLAVRRPRNSGEGAWFPFSEPEKPQEYLQQQEN